MTVTRTLYTSHQAAPSISNAYLDDTPMDSRLLRHPRQVSPPISPTPTTRNPITTHLKSDSQSFISKEWLEKVIVLPGMDV